MILREIEYEYSLIVPVLNEEKHLPAFLNSLAAQKGSFELIAVDGGSRDRSREIIDSYRDRIQVTGLIDETRNMGFVRNRGAVAARGKVLIFTNSDSVLPGDFLEKIGLEFQDHSVAAVSGKTIPLNGGVICSAAYCAFDFLRWFFSKIGRFSPSGNFLALKTYVFDLMGGFRRLRVNEDGELGIRLSEFARESGVKLIFSLEISAAHYAERFQKGALKTLLFYGYVFGNFHPVLRRILKGVEKKSAAHF